MAASKIPTQNTKTGRTVLTPTGKRIAVSARDVMATLLDVMAQAQKRGMKTAAKTLDHNGDMVVIVAFAITGMDVVAEGGTFKIAGRAITDPAAWEDLRDVMADE